MNNKNLKQKLRSKLAALTCASLFALSFAAPAVAVDVDQDSRSDLTLYREADATANAPVWYILPTTETEAAAFQWGLTGDEAVPGNYNNTNGTDITVFRPSVGFWFHRQWDAALLFANTTAYQWGLPGDEPLACDFNGDGLDDQVVWRPATGTWYVLNSNAATPANTFSTATVQQWGLEDDEPLAGDFDTDGNCDFAVFRDGVWLIVPSSLSTAVGASIPWGTEGDTPVSGHFDSDNIRDLAVYRVQNGQGFFIIRHSTLAGLTSTTLQWGLEGDDPVIADVDGDGQADVGVFRPSSGTWFFRTSSSSYASSTAQTFGLNGDEAIGNVGAARN